MRTGRRDPARGARDEPTDAELVDVTSLWFIRHGLPYFVPEQRESARRALWSRRTAAMLVVTVLAALGAGVALAWLVEDATAAAPPLLVIVGAAVALYAVTALRAGPIASWAVGRAVGSLRLLLPLVTRALPLLLLFITFLFINAEVWQVSATLDGGVLWLTVALFAVVGVAFLLVRLPEELDSVDATMGPDELVEACRGTPLEQRAHRAVQTQPGAACTTTVAGFERANLLLVLVIAQAVQVLLLSVSVFAFFLVFGGIVMSEGVQESWIQGTSHALPYLSHLSVELVQVSVFLAAFSGLYFTVYAVTEDSYRDQFFTEVKNELDRAVGVRAVYLALRTDAGR